METRSPAKPPPTKPTKPTGPNSALTISDGTDSVLINGVPVDFGVAVHDLAWSPDGTRGAFIDGDGNLVVSDAAGGGRIVVAANPGGQQRSHPASPRTSDARLSCAGQPPHQ